MTIPSQEKIKLPLLKTLVELGGRAKPRDIYPRLATYFPELTKEDLEERVASTPSTLRWTNRVQWTRQQLVDSGDLLESERGIWEISPQGRQRLANWEASGHDSESVPKIPLKELFTLILTKYPTEYRKGNTYANPFMKSLRISIKETFEPITKRYGIRVRPLGGQGALRKSSQYTSFPATGHKTSKGIYPVYFYDFDRQVVTLHIGTSETFEFPDSLMEEIRRSLEKKLVEFRFRSAANMPLKEYGSADLDDEVLNRDLNQVMKAYADVLEEFESEFEDLFGEEDVAREEVEYIPTEAQLKTLIERFLKWHETSEHRARSEGARYEFLNENFFRTAPAEKIVDEIYKFAHEGGAIQSGGSRTSGKLRESIRRDPESFRAHVLELFSGDFDLEEWWDGCDEFVGFGEGIRSIFLARLFPDRYAVLNGRSLDGYQRLGLLPSPIPRKSFEYGLVVEAAKKLAALRPEEMTLLRADAMTYYLFGTDEGKAAFEEVCGYGVEARVEESFVAESNAIEVAVTEVKYSREDALRDLFMPEAVFDKIIESLRIKKNVILQGPPGVGKTFVAKRAAYTLLGCKNERRVQTVQFHQSYSYEDFIQGYRPKESGGFQLKNGVFYEFCKAASRDLGNDYVLIIDEINRGNVSKIFGELMMLIEADKRGNGHSIALTYSDNSGEKFYVPENVYLIGTMNTADRSLALVDYALRRRFRFITLSPEFLGEKFRESLLNKGVTSAMVERIRDRLCALNEIIAKDTKDLGPGYQIGHSYFVNGNEEITDERRWYEDIVRLEIEPLLSEYWFDREEKAKEEAERLLG